MTSLEQLTASIAMKKEVNPAIERWLLRVTSIQKTLVENVIFLCRYTDSFTDEILVEYAKALDEALQNSVLEEKINVSKRLSQRIYEFLSRLEDTGQDEIARTIRAAAEKRIAVEG